jgi:hypothetical protein
VIWPKCFWVVCNPFEPFAKGPFLTAFLFVLIYSSFSFGHIQSKLHSVMQMVPNNHTLSPKGHFAGEIILGIRANCKTKLANCVAYAQRHACAWARKAKGAPFRARLWLFRLGLRGLLGAGGQIPLGLEAVDGLALLLVAEQADEID